MDVHKNFAYSTVATAPSPATSGTSLVVAAGKGADFPAVPFNATIWPVSSQPTNANAEIVRVTARSTDTLTITRAQEGSSARTVVVGDQIAATITAKVIQDAEAVEYATRSSNTVLSINDKATAFSMTAAFTQTLNADEDLGDGWWVIIRNDAGVNNIVTIDPAGAETINGASTYLLRTGETILLMCNGSGSNFNAIQLSLPYDNWTTIVKATDESVNSAGTGTTLQTDDELQFATVSGAVYEMEAVTIFASPVGAGTPDIKMAWGEDGTLRGAMVPVTWNTSDATAALTPSISNASANNIGTAAANRAVRHMGTHVGAGGTYAFYWAQVTSNANNVTVRAGSYLRYRRLL